ncbi:hypothetical protein Tco_0765048 [Tanacetum coccineum]
MVSFRRLHSHLKLLSNNDLKGTRIESGFKHAFATLFGQDLETFTGPMFLNMEQLEKQLDNEEFQEIGSMAAFKVNGSQMQTTEEKVDMSKALDASLVDTKSSGTESVEKDTSSRSGNDAHADDENIKPNDEEQWLRNQSVFRQPTVFKSEGPRISKPRFASQVDVNNDLSKLVTTHYLPKERDYAFAKPHHMIAPSSSRYSSNDMVHNHYLKEAKKKTQEAVDGLRWVPTGKIFTSSTTKVDSEPTNGSNNNITNQFECKQTLDVSACTLNLSAETRASRNFLDVQAMTSDYNSSKLRIHDHINEPSCSKLVPKVVPSADKTAISRQELELLFHHHITLLRSTYIKMEMVCLIPAGVEFITQSALPTTKTYYKHQDSRVSRKLKN